MAAFALGFATAPLVRRFGARIVIGTGCLFGAAAFTSMALWHDATWQLYASTTLQGVGQGLVFSSLAGVVIASVPSDQTGVASGMNANIRTIGGSIGSAVMAGVVTARPGPDGLPLESGYVFGFGLLALGMILAAAASALLPNIHDQPTRDGLEDADNASLGMMPAGPALTRPIRRRASSELAEVTGHDR